MGCHTWCLIPYEKEITYEQVKQQFINNLKFSYT